MSDFQIDGWILSFLTKVAEDTIGEEINNEKVEFYSKNLSTSSDYQ